MLEINNYACKVYKRERELREMKVFKALQGAARTGVGWESEKRCCREERHENPESEKL
jgi:hypothetical protein